ncbi:unnamed protein product [Tenebrio molitor]|nr:unnamed protein product [Tenebrio molitor]
MNTLSDITNIENDTESSGSSKRSYLTVVDNLVAQKMIANVYSFFKENDLHLGPISWYLYFRSLLVV